MNAFDEFIAISKQFEDSGIEYALVGGIAMAFHATPRFTRDIDILIEPKELEKVTAILEKQGYFASASPWTFKNTPLTLYRFLKIRESDEMMIDVLVAGTDKHKEIIQGVVIAESELGSVPVANKEDLIWLKQIRNSKQDQVDIEELKK